jgi:hypothetical protein
VSRYAQQSFVLGHESLVNPLLPGTDAGVTYWVFQGPLLPLTETKMLEKRAPTAAWPAFDSLSMSRSATCCPRDSGCGG